MKKLILLILLLPFFAKAQNVTMNKTGGQLRTVVSSVAQDTVPMVTGTLTNGYILKYNSSTKKWYASPDPTYPGLQDSLTKKANRTFDNVGSGAIAKSKADTSSNGLLPKSNLFPLGDTRYLRGVGTGVTSVTGTTNQITSTGTTAPVLSIPSSFIAPGSIKATTSIATGTTGTAGSIAFMRSSDGATGSTIDQFGDNTLRLTSSGGTKQIDAVSDAFNISGALKFPISTATLAAGDMGYNSIYGQYLRGKTGSTDDWTIFAAGGGYVMHNPTGTNGVAYAALEGSGNVIVGADNNGLTSKIAIGSGLSLVSGTLTATGGSSGTVTTPGMTAGRVVVANSASDVGTPSTMTLSGNDLTVDGTINVSSSKNGAVGSFTNSDATNGYGVQINSEGSASTRYALTVRNLAANQTYLHVSTETGSKGSVIVGSSTPYTGLSSSGFTVNGTSYGSIGLNVNDVNKGYLTGYSDGLILQPVGKLVLSNNTGNVIIGTTTDDGVNKFQVTGNTAITGNITASNLSGTNTGDQTTISGNAGTATALQTARTIAGVSFDGTANISLNNNAITNGAGYITSSALSPYAPLASPALTGSPTAPTQSAGDNSTKIATTAYVDGAISSIASSNTYTPTPSAGANSVTITPRVHMYNIVGKIVTVYGSAVIDYTNDNTTTIFSMTLPAGVGGGGFPTVYSASGSGSSITTSNVDRTVFIDAITSTSSVIITSTSPITIGKQYEVRYSFMYKIN